MPPISEFSSDILFHYCVERVGKEDDSMNEEKGSEFAIGVGFCTI